MTLAARMRETGQFLFRWRSYLPLAFLMVLAPALAVRQQEGPWDWVWDALCLGLGLLGLLVRVLAAGYAAPGTSGRNTRGQRAASLNTSGLYSLVRHPLYLGNFLIWVGLSLDLGTWWYSLIAALAFWFYYERIMLAEESFLESRFGPEFLAWAERTPAFIPRLRGWRRPERPFSWKRVLRNEHPTLASILLVYSVLEVVSDLITVHSVRLEPDWLVPLGLGLVVYLVLRLLKKWTRVLQEA